MKDQWGWVDYTDPKDKPLISERTVAWILVIAFLVGAFAPWHLLPWGAAQ